MPPLFPQDDRGFRQLLVACATVLATGCQQQLPASTQSGIESKVGNLFTNVSVAAGGRSFTLMARDGKALGSLQLQAGSQLYMLKDGSFHLPAAGLEQIKGRGGFFHIFAPGYVPRQVWIGQADDKVVLNPVVPALAFEQFTRAGGQVGTADSLLKLSIPPNTVMKSPTQVTMGTFDPTVTANDQKAFAATRTKLLAAVAKAQAKPGAKKSYHLSDDDCELPCGLEGGLGVLLTVNGELQPPGPLVVSYDLGVLASGVGSSHGGDHGDDHGDHQDDHGGSGSPHAGGSGFRLLDAGGGGHQAIADRIRKTFKYFDDRNLRSVLLDQCGLSLSGNILSVRVHLSSSATTDGYVLTTIDGGGEYALGIKLDIVLVSALHANALPSPANLATVLGLDAAQTTQTGATLRDVAGNPVDLSTNALFSPEASIAGRVMLPGLASDNGSGILSNNGSGVISNNGGKVISNNGGSLSPKYKLMAYDTHPAAVGSVRALDQNGFPLTGWRPVDANGRFLITNIPPGAIGHVFIEAVVGSRTLYALAPANGGVVTLADDVSAATTGVAAIALDLTRSGVLRPEQISLAGYRQDVATLLSTMTLNQALTLVGVATATQAAQVGGGVLQAAAGSAPAPSQMLPAGQAVPGTPASAASAATGQAPDGTQILPADGSSSGASGGGDGGSGSGDGGSGDGGSGDGGSGDGGGGDGGGGDGGGGDGGGGDGGGGDGGG